MSLVFLAKTDSKLDLFGASTIGSRLYFLDVYLLRIMFWFSLLLYVTEINGVASSSEGARPLSRFLEKVYLPIWF